MQNARTGLPQVGLIILLAHNKNDTGDEMYTLTRGKQRKLLRGKNVGKNASLEANRSLSEHESLMYMNLHTTADESIRCASFLRKQSIHWISVNRVPLHD